MDTRWVRRLAAGAAAVTVGGCISISSTATDDFDFEERFGKASSEIVERSTKAEEAATRGQSARLAPEAAAYLQRHFTKADELVSAHAERLHKASGAGGFGRMFLDPYSRRRVAVLDFTTKLKTRVVVVESANAAATALPHGHVLVSRAMVQGFRPEPEGFDVVLLGVLVHELIHVRDGHALEQWSTADSRRAWASDKFLGALGDMTVLIPFLSVKYDKQYPLTFGAAKQLPELSEYAADLGAVSLLQQAGMDGARYVAFLREASERDAGARERRPSLLQQRVGCLRLLSDTRLEAPVKGILIGSPDSGDKTWQTVDLEDQLGAMALLDAPQQLAEKYPGRPGMPHAERRAAVLDATRKVAYTGCAIRQAFPDTPLRDGVLVTPTFDLLMFLQYL